MITASDFYVKTFLDINRASIKTTVGVWFDLPLEADLSHFCDLSTIQESFRFRATHRSRQLAIALIDDSGLLRRDALTDFIQQFEKTPFIPFPSASADGRFSEYLLKVLKRLEQQPAFYQAIKKNGRPLYHKTAENLIRHTFNLPQTISITDAHIRRAVLAACLSPLRQNIGSCFATAPAILIHDEQVDSMLADFYELLSTGKLKRIFGGVEYVVPLSPSVGIGDLRKTAYSKTGEPLPIWYSPGLLAAFEAAGLIDPQMGLNQKFSFQKQLITPYLEREMTIESLIRKVLLKHFGLAEADLEQHKAARHSFLIKKEIWVEKKSKKKEILEQMREKEEEAKAAFKAFADLPLLKAWEFTLASFSEVKMEFSRWNLYSSLGLNYQEPNGIGSVIYHHIEKLLENSQRKMEQYHREYELAYDQLRATEILLKNAGSESEVRRLQTEFRSRQSHLFSCQEVRDRFYRAASCYSTFFSFLMEQYDQKFKEYFQEIYDADMQDVQTDLYDDSPAGFRLVYKHGRSDSSTWTLIYTAQQWIEVLVDFFKIAEVPIAALCNWDTAHTEIAEISSAIISHIQTEGFLESAFVRMAKAHLVKLPPFPLKKIEKIEKKPWAYTSGGTMPTLLKTYFRREGGITEEARWVESEIDLLGFILDTLKNLPPRITDPFVKSPEKGMLMYSPTHAFILHPGWPSIKSGWQEEGFTYTWIRDKIVLPGKEFYGAMRFSISQQKYLIDQFYLELRRANPHFPSLVPGISVAEFRDILAPSCHSREEKDQLDGFLYKMLPLISGKEWKTSLLELTHELFDAKKLLDEYPDVLSEWVGAKMIRDAAKGLFLLGQKTSLCSIDIDRLIGDAARQRGYSSPGVLLFADTNWTNYAFAFVVNPATGELELWRTDFTGSEGLPMTDWKSFSNGSERIPWGIYTCPHEYTL